jgi:hypothetical protein
MQNDLIITRIHPEATEPDESDLITLDNWKTLVESDPELNLEESVGANLGTGFSFKVSGTGLAVWTAYPLAKMQGVAALFIYRKGTVVAKNADMYIREKALEIAAKLNAGLLAEHGWLLPLPAKVTLKAKAEPAEEVIGKRPWWRFW